MSSLYVSIILYALCIGFELALVVEVCAETYDVFPAILPVGTLVSLVSLCACLLVCKVCLAVLIVVFFAGVSSGVYRSERISSN